MTDSIDTSERKAEEPRRPLILPVREMRDEPVPPTGHVRLREVAPHRLMQLKRELQQFNATTGKWKERK